MKDSQRRQQKQKGIFKYIKESNERFSTFGVGGFRRVVSISRRVMKDSQPVAEAKKLLYKYIKESNERFPTTMAYVNSER